MRNEHYPDAWIILDIRFLEEKKSVRKILSSYNDELGVPVRWTLNSGIAKASKIKNIWKFTGNSGSIYYCDTNNYEINSYMKTALNIWYEYHVHKFDLIINIIELEDLERI
jgi:hypothetical protein